MKIYTKIILDKNNKPIEQEYYNYFGPQMKSRNSQIHLTPAGFDRANKLRIKLDLPEISWDSAGHPQSLIF